MNAEDRTMQIIKWKEQAVTDCVTWAKIKTHDEKLLDAYKAGASAGWDQCLNVLKLHGLLNIN
jgi:hypothetical protein